MKDKGSKTKIKKMPSKKMLEEFLDGLNKVPTVIFDTDKGRFEKNI